MKSIITTLFIFLFCFPAIAQLEYKDVAPIFFNKCTPCHRPNGGAPFSLMGYSATIPWVSLIDPAVQMGKMPPWMPDTTYTRFLHERVLTAGEKNAILNWISTGATQGDTTQAPPLPTYPPYQLNGIPSLVLQIPTFTSNATTNDSYVCFSLPTNLTQDRILRAFEIVPGDPSIVHHVVVNVDTVGNTTNDLSGNCFNAPGNFSIGAYAPGSPPTVFPGVAPLKAGIRIKAGSRMVLQIHYPAGSAGMQDSTKIRLYFYPVNATGVRNMYVSTPLQNWSLSIPANTTASFSAQYPNSGGIPLPISIYGTFPHRHKICTKIVNYAFIPGDTIPIIRINDWDFDWQGFYTLPFLKKIPAGYKLFARHWYDNTSSNPHNPNNPPINVFAGTGSNDEMLFDAFQYLIYNPGDENINIGNLLAGDSLLAGIATPWQDPSPYSFAFPNPFSHQVSVSFNVSRPSPVRLEVFNAHGQRIYIREEKSLPAGNFEWTINPAKGNDWPSGLYFYQVTQSGQKASGKIIRTGQ
jgi:hypothetical protein